VRGDGAGFSVAARGEREIALTRVFEAPRALVFEALTRPEHIRRWLLGPPGWTMAVCEVDLRVGGAYRFVWRRDDGTELGMGGVYREIAPPERLVHTERFDAAWYPGEAVVTTVLIEEGGRTKLASTVSYVSRDARDAVLRSGMEAGVAASYDRLAGLLGSAAGR
jgi:uncharacterized protein YndB with AHSA1/START domain